MSKRKYSAVWLYFEEREGKKALCKICNAIISFAGGSQGNLMRHIRLKHHGTPLPSEKFAKVKRYHKPVTVKREPSNDELPSTSNQIKIETQDHEMVEVYAKPSSERRTNHEEIDRQVLRMIAKGHHSFRFVEEPEFKKLIEQVSSYPGYTLPTRKRLSNTLLPKVQKELLEDIKKKISYATDVCLSTDRWFSRAKIWYVAVTAHYINPDTELTTHLLDCEAFEEGYTSQDIYKYLKKVISEFGISHKVTVIVSDNEPDMVHAICQGEWLGIGCFARSLNSTVENAMEAITETIDKVRKITEYLCKNLSILNELRMVQELMGLSEVELKEDDETKWNSTYEMFQSVTQIKDAVISTILSNNPNLTLSSKDWEIIEETLSILKPFNEIVKEISEEKYLSLSKVTVFCNILDSFISKSLPLNEEVGIMLSSLQMGLFSCSGNIDKEYLYAESVILDPRFKRRGFRNETLYEEAVMNLRNKICSLRLDETEEVIPATISKTIVTSESLWDGYDLECESERSDSEFDKYLSDVYLNRTMDPFVWWKERKNIYPSVYLYALKRLCIVATSVPCDQLFSATGQIISEQRNLLKPDKVEGLAFLHRNM